MGDAVLTAQDAVGDDPFAVVLGDDIVVNPGGPSAIKQCINDFESRESGSVIGLVEVPKTETHKYGIADIGADFQIKRFVEKPRPEEAPSRWALPGRYVFEKGIFDYIRKIGVGKQNEIQLTDAMELMQKDQPYFACKLAGERFDTGDKLGYIKANVAFALKRSEYREDLKSWLKTLDV